MTATLELRSVSKAFGDFVVVDRLSLAASAVLQAARTVRGPCELVQVWFRLLPIL